MKHCISKISAAFLIMMSIVPLTAFADPIYSAGETLEPQCAPESLNCSVSVLSIGSSVGSGTPGSIPFIDLSGALQQDNANLKWDEVNKKLVLSKGLVLGSISTVHSVAVGDSPEVLVISGNYAYVSTKNDKSIEIIDISDPENAVLVNSIQMPGNAEPSRPVIAGNYLYVNALNAMNVGLVAIDISDPENASIVDTINVTQLQNAPLISGNYAYLASGSEFNIIDISNPAAMSLAGTATGGDPDDYFQYTPVKIGNYAFSVTPAYSSSYPSLSVMNVSMPGSASEVTSLQIADSPRGVIASGNYLYVALQNYDIQVIDVSNPLSPSIIRTIPGGNGMSQLPITVGTYMYVANNYDNAMSIIDISNPATASVISTVAVGESPQGVAVAGNYAFTVNEDNNNMSVIDISNPLAPFVIATASVGSGPFGYPVVSGSYVYVANSSADSVSVIDISEADDVLPPGDVVALQVDGTIQSSILSGSGTIALYADSNGNIVPSFSDGSLKENVENVTNALDKIRFLQGKYFNWKDTARFGSQRELGFIAQEVESYVPEVVRSVGSYKTLNYQNLVALQNEGIKELDIRLASIESIAGLDEASATRSLMGRFTEFMSSTAKKVIGGIVEFKGSILAKDAQIDNGITVRDRITGSLVCMTVTNGSLMTIPGSCDSESVQPDIVAPESAIEEVPVIVDEAPEEPIEPEPVPETPAPVEAPSEAALVSSQQEHATPTASGTAH